MDDKLREEILAKAPEILNDETLPILSNVLIEAKNSKIRSLCFA